MIGVGHLGKHHARILSSLPGVELVAVVDTNRSRAEEIASAHGTLALFDAQELLGRVDAVTIAVPTELHRSIALPFLQARVPVLVEKPIARSLEEADEMIDAAGDAGVVLAVGHTERFNPALAVARPLLTDPRFIEVHRLGTFPERSLDIDVVFDLDDPRPRCRAVARELRCRVARCRRRAGRHQPRRHRQRQVEVRERLHRQPDGEPHQPGAGAEDPLLSAGVVPVDRLRGAEGRPVAAGHGASRPSTARQAVH